MVCSTCPSMRIPLPILPMASATCSTTCWLKSVVPMVKRRGTLRAPSSRTRPVQRTFPPLILFIDLLSFKLETSQVVEVRMFYPTSTPSSSPHNFPVDILAAQHLLFLFSLPDNSWPASALKCTPASPHTITPDASPLPSCIPITPTTPFLMCSGLMVVGHRLDCYSLLSVVFAVFLGFPGHGSLAQDILSLLTLILRCASSNSTPL